MAYTCSNKIYIVVLLNYYWYDILVNCLSHQKCWVKANSVITIKVSENICAWTVCLAS